MDRLIRKGREIMVTKEIVLRNRSVAVLVHDTDGSGEIFAYTVGPFADADTGEAWARAYERCAGDTFDAADRKCEVVYNLLP